MYFNRHFFCGVFAFFLVHAFSASAQPPNNDFADAIVLTTDSGQLSADNEDADLEDGEPVNSDNSGETTVWWTWTAPDDLGTIFLTHGSNFDTNIAELLSDGGLEVPGANLVLHKFVA
jgi:hypothetical protein